ncbi:MAG: outer membrane lipoprotein carrier protein LolA [Fimbriimonadaceae bacterium]|nr:outer membrane lipoprotein carrier protein LolA [Alphaproteobacteria bacterium]
MIQIKSVAVAFLMLAFGVISSDPGLAKGNQAPLSPQQAAVLERVNGYFNALVHLQGRFTQIGPNGEFSQGTFYIARPGKVRFEYEAPNPILIVADGFWVGIEDRRLKTTDKYPLSATPLSLLLDERVNLREEARIIDAREEEGFLSITFEDNSGISPGQLTLIFGSDDLMLRQWIVLDGQGLRTEVSLFDQLAGAPMDPKLFWIKDNAAVDVGNR